MGDLDFLGFKVVEGFFLSRVGEKGLSGLSKAGWRRVARECGGGERIRVETRLNSGFVG